MWLQWAKDEIVILQEEDDREPIYKIFRRAATDYQCEPSFSLNCFSHLRDFLEFHRPHPSRCRRLDRVL